MKTTNTARVALKYAARIAPPMQMGSANMLKRQGLTPVKVYLDAEGLPTVVQPWRGGPVIELGDMVQNRRGALLYFAGVASDGKAILGKTEQEAKRLNKKVIEDRKRWPPDPSRVATMFLTRLASTNPLMLQPDYGHGDAAVPGDQGYHPCQHGGPCQCGGQCGCGKKAAVRKMMAASPLFKKMLKDMYGLTPNDGAGDYVDKRIQRSRNKKEIEEALLAYGRKYDLDRIDGRWASQKSASPRGIKDLQPNKWYISTEDGDTYGPYPNEAKAKSDGKAAFGGSTEYVVAKGDTIRASVLNPRKFGLFTPEELVK